MQQFIELLLLCLVPLCLLALMGLILTLIGAF